MDSILNPPVKTKKKGEFDSGKNSEQHPYRP